MKNPQLLGIIILHHTMDDDDVTSVADSADYLGSAGSDSLCSSSACSMPELEAAFPGGFVSSHVEDTDSPIVDHAPASFVSTPIAAGPLVTPATAPNNRSIILDDPGSAVRCLEEQKTPSLENLGAVASSVPQDVQGVSETDEAPPQKKRKISTHSVAHEDLNKSNCVFLSLDLEHGGEKCGIVQLSVVAFDQSYTVLGEFDTYVKPDCDASDWSDHSVINPLDERIQNAPKLEEAWPLFVNFVEGHLDGGDKTGIIVAWGGQGCDCQWLWRVTEDTHRGKLFLPRW